jgi:hypothetical protein
MSTRQLITRAVIAIITALAITSAALADVPDGQSASTAIPLSSGAGTYNVTGASSGSYRYFSMISPSNNCEVTVVFDFTPAEEPVANAIGVVAWQNGSQLGTMNGVSGKPGTSTFAFKPLAAGPVTLQVYSYFPAVAVSFGLRATVVDRAIPTGTPAPTSTPAPQSATLPAQPEQTVTAVLPGNAYGSFQYYQYNYAGDGSPRTLTLQVSPNGVDTTNAVFLTAYQDGKTLASGSVGQSPVLGVLSLTYSSASSSQVLVQVANYNFAKTITYTLSNSK